MGQAGVFDEILVPVDGSIPSLTAQEVAASVAKKFDSKVTVIHVISHEFMNPQLQRFSPDQPDYAYRVEPQAAPVVRIRKPSAIPVAGSVFAEITASLHQRGEGVIAAAVALFKESGIDAKQRLVEHARPTETIVEEAEKGKYSLIVVGRSAGEEEKKPHVGSIAAKITGRSKIPVLVTAEGTRISKILVPLDGSEVSEKAAEIAGVLAAKTGSNLTLLHVQEPYLLGLRPDVSKQVGLDILSSGEKRVKGAKVDKKLESGNAAKVIVDFAEKGKYDLILMGGRGHSAMRHWLLGSVSDHVLHYANTAVMIVK